MLSTILLSVLAVLSALGYLRTAAFVINKTIFGHRHEKPFLKWTVWAIAPLFLTLTYLLLPLFRERASGESSELATWGAYWLALTAGIGLYWIVERAVMLMHQKPVTGTRLIQREVIRLRKAHLPFQLQRLGLHNDVYDLEVNHYAVVISDLPDSFQRYRIAFLSDLHVERFMHRKLYDTCLEKVSQLDCDLVLFGGDFVSRKRAIPAMAEMATRGLAPRDGSFAVLGNHDYWSDAPAIVEALTEKGVRFLNNESVSVIRGTDQIRVVGLDEVYRGEPEIDHTLNTIRDSTPRIVVSHHPDIVDRIKNERIDLLLCGHTHGGQIRLPFFGPLLVPSLHEGRYDCGFFRMRRLLMYVSRGIGAVPPVRILCRPELAVFELVKT